MEEDNRSKNLIEVEEPRSKKILIIPGIIIGIVIMVIEIGFWYLLGGTNFSIYISIVEGLNLVLSICLIVIKKTRYLGIGLLIGSVISQIVFGIIIALLVILLFGACMSIFGGNVNF